MDTPIGGPNRGEAARRALRNAAPLLGFALIFLFFAAATQGTTVRAINLKILLNQAVITAVVATGAIFAFASGALDMSLAGTVGLAAVCGALAGRASGSVAVMICACAAVSLFIGLAKGLISAYIRLPVFIVTIVLGSVLGAVGLIFLGDETIISVSDIVAVRDPTWVNLLVLVGYYLASLALFNYTRIGKSCKLQGGNPEAARLSGINPRMVIIVSFLVGAVGIALAAILLLVNTKTASVGTGGDIMTNIMVAVVLGGMPLSGGPRSRISAALVGSATITVLNNGLVVIGAGTGVIQAVRGVIFLTVVFITSMNYRTRLLPR